MTEEEKKAVERIEDTFYSDLGKGINKFQKITLYEDSIRDVRILLNLLEKLQKENEKALDEYMKWQKQELNQKDKIIDLMAETINNHDIDEDICKQMGQKANCNEFEDTEKCKECIKQFFINKAKR